MATIANLDVNLRANTLKYDSRLKRSGENTKRFGNAARNAGSSAGALAGSLASFAATGAAAAIAALGAISAAAIKMAFDFAKAGDEIAKAAKQTQLSTDDYQSLVFAIELNGGKASDLSTAVRGLNRNYYDLSRGLSTAKDVFEELNLTQQDLQRLETADQFRLVVKQLGLIEDHSKRAAIATRVFGRSGDTLIPLIDNLAEGERRFAEIGGGVGRDALEVAEKMQDANLELAHAFKMLKAEIFLAIGPSLIQFLQQAAIELRRFKDDIDSVMLALGLQAGRAAGGGLKAKKLVEPAKTSVRSAVPKLEERVELQRQIVDALRENTAAVGPLPQALQKGTTAQFGFINQLKRQQEAAAVRAREQKKIDIAEKQLDRLENLVKLHKDRERKLELEGVQVIP